MALNLLQGKDEKYSRQKLNLEQANHLFEYLSGSNLIQDVAYGTVTIKYDSGERQMLPHAVITAVRSHAIQEYKHYCQEQLLLQKGQCLSNSSLWRILKNIKPSQKHAMAGLDSIAANRLKGFLLLEDIVSTLTDAKLKRVFLRQVEQSKQYLKIGYRLHCETFSNCDTHCISFALSNTKSESLQIKHNHLHNETCHQCALLMSTIKAITNLVTDVSSDEDERDELLYDVNIAKSNILEWMAHILRGVQQETAKTLAINQPSQTKGFCLSDWAQKILPIRYREGQKEFFGK